MNSTRRDLVGGLTLGAMVSLFDARPRSASAEPPPETTTLRLARRPVVCHAPVLIAEPLLRSEGFTTVHWVNEGAMLPYYEALAAGEVEPGLRVLRSDHRAHPRWGSRRLHRWWSPRGRTYPVLRHGRGDLAPLAPKHGLCATLSGHPHNLAKRQNERE
jgi:hypothetical protein